MVNSKARCHRPRSDAQLAGSGGCVGIDRAPTYDQFAGDLSVGQSVCQQPQHFDLACGCIPNFWQILSGFWLIPHSGYAHHQSTKNSPKIWDAPTAACGVTVGQELWYTKAIRRRFVANFRGGQFYVDPTTHSKFQIVARYGADALCAFDWFLWPK